MSSLRRIESSRANGALSHGPVTDAGKKISSQNAIRHGLLAKIVVLDNESSDGFEEGLVEHLQRFRPADAVELGIIEEMVAAQWRVRRSWCLETDLLNSRLDIPDPGNGIAPIAGAFKDPDDSHGLALLNRYEARHHNVYWRSVKNLLLLRTAFPPGDSTPVFGLDLPLEPAADAPAMDAPAAPDTPLPNEPIFGRPAASDSSVPHPEASHAPDPLPTLQVLPFPTVAFSDIALLNEPSPIFGHLAASEASTAPSPQPSVHVGASEASQTPSPQPLAPSPASAASIGGRL